MNLRALFDARGCAAALVVLGLASASTFAADTVEAGDPEAGKEKSTICAACHGADGNSLNPVWPSIAGQHVKYLTQQLEYFKGGDRNNVLMSAQAVGLSDQDIKDLAAYYASQTAVFREVSDPSNVDVGKRLYIGGDKERGIPACIACHGPQGAGNPGVPYPIIGGQHAAYTASALRTYAEDGDKRSNVETQHIMTTISLKLEPAEIDALASYLQGLN